MKGSQPRQRRTACSRIGVVAVAVVALTACSDDADDAVDGTLVVDEDFPGDSLDAACARLEAGTGDDEEAIAAALLDELAELGGPQLAANTLELAVVDRCPDWADAVTAAIEARS